MFPLLHCQSWWLIPNRSSLAPHVLQPWRVAPAISCSRQDHRWWHCLLMSQQQPALKAPGVGATP